MTVATSTIPESKIGNLKKSLQLSQIHPKFLRMVSKLPTVKGPLNNSLESALSSLNASWTEVIYLQKVRAPCFTLERRVNYLVSIT